jgi:2-polyprenyl-6-hydroxyphenyl methylase/3-demethylubiquinone-9 3-methyltransferase
MAANRQPYPVDHWLRSSDPAPALSAYLEQQSKAYSRVKNDFIAELLGDFQGRSFLDYGCGAGMFLVQAARRAASLVVGVDAESAALATARYFLQQAGLADHCHLIVSEEFPSVRLHNRFDLILLKDVLEHVADDQGLLNNAAKCLAPGGCLILSTQNALSLNYLTQGNYHRIWLGDQHWFGWDPTHLRFYTPVSLRRQLLRAGLRPVAWRSAYIVPYKFPAPKSSRKQFIRFDRLSWLDRILGRVGPFNRLGWNIIVKAGS